MKIVAFFNNKGGVGKTTLVYHLAWMFSRKEIKTLAVDLDPQANLTAMFLQEKQLEGIWPDGEHPKTIYGAIRPITRGLGDVLDTPYVEIIEPSLFPTLGLIPGDLGLSLFEDKLSESWPKCHNGEEQAFRAMTAFYRIIEKAAKEYDLVLVDIGPNLGAINRSALISCDHVVLPLAADLYSLQGLKNLGPTLRSWRKTWGELKSKAPGDLSYPSGDMKPAGYVVMQHGARKDRPVKAYDRWMAKIPEVYRQSILGEKKPQSTVTVSDDPYKLALLKHYHSLMPLAQESHKPMFDLKPADGAIGAHVESVQGCYRDFEALAKRLAQEIELVWPDGA